MHVHRWRDGFAMSTVRQAAVAGLLYPDNAKQLRNTVADHLKAAKAPVNALQPKAIIVPHAGYHYSGAIAAAAYKTLQSTSTSINNIVLIGAAHRQSLTGIAIVDVDAFRTPLGDVYLNHTHNQQLGELQPICVSNAAHLLEHSLEVQLPFLQVVLSNFTITPIIIGDTTHAEVAAILNRFWGDQHTLIVISSDLNNHRDYRQVNYIDRSTCEAIEALNIEAVDRQNLSQCIAVNSLLRVAQKKNLQVETLAISQAAKNSPELQGKRFASWAFYES